jgi:putrescine aminotransferase
MINTKINELIQEIEEIENSKNIEEILEIYYNNINPTLTKIIKLAGYAKIEKKGQDYKIIAYDINNQEKEFYDFLGMYGVLNLGHCNQYIVNKIKEQMNELCMTSKVFLNSKYAALAKLLTNLTGLKYLFLVNSGTEAVEGAIKLSLASTKKKKIISTYNSYHGKTLGALSISGRDVYKKYLTLLPNVIFVEYNNIDQLQKVIDNDTAAIIVEPIQGEGGIIIPTDNYLPTLREICDKNNCLLIIDEIQTGLGRTGYLFEYQRYNIKPDILLLAKALSGGVIPIGAILANEKAWEIFNENPLYHTSTFGGNSLAITAALETIKYTLSNDLPKQAQEKGEYFTKKLNQISINYKDIVKEVRGKGLMIGIELISEEYAASIFSYLIQNGIITAYTLNQPKVIRIEPPLTIPYSVIDLFINTFEESLKHTKQLFEL